MNEVIREFEPAPVPADLPFDPEKYREEIMALQLPEDQAIELLERLWSIMRMFVEIGYTTDVSELLLNQLFNGAARGSDNREP